MADAHDSHAHDDHGHAPDAHGHGHADDHGHGHGAPAGDIIPEGSPQDMALTGLAFLALCGLLAMMFWFFEPGGKPADHGHGTPAHHEETPAGHGDTSSATPGADQAPHVDEHTGAPESAPAHH